MYQKIQLSVALTSSLIENLNRKIIHSEWSQILDLCFQCQVNGVSGQSGLPAPGPVGQSQCPATGAVAVPSPRVEEQPALENRRYTTGSEFKSRDSPAPSSPSVLVGHLFRTYITLIQQTILTLLETIMYSQKIVLSVVSQENPR